MSEKEKMIINRLPAITWNRLNMNEAKIDYPGTLQDNNIEVICPSPVVYSKLKSYEENDITTLPGGLGEDSNRLIKESNLTKHSFTLSENIDVNEPIKININYTANNALGNYVEIDVKEHSSLTVIMDYTSDSLAEGFFMVQTKVKAAANSKVRIVQIQRVGSNVLFLNDFSGKADTDSDVKLIQLILDGEDSYSGVKFKLIGNRANFNLDTGYRLKKKEKLDINYLVEHFAPNSTCDIQVNGVLRDEADKTFRGTIDLKRGAFDADGNEQETVLALDDSVINRSLPVILCGEENVQGNHGATMGRLDEELLFYLETRGIPKKQVYEIMAMARIENVINKIEDNETKVKLLKYIKGEENE